ncbi:MAG: 4-alpha-glucanotransferase [Myxococcales bacterium]|nr:4-alpha-glucanotransferase [Myxococcales bacterium]
MDFFARRRFGVLLHPSSLPGPRGIGDLGAEAYRFVDWLHRAGAGVWQVLPLCPPGGSQLDTPYVSWAALAGNPQLISLEQLVQDGLLSSSELPAGTFAEGWAHPKEAMAAKVLPLRAAARRLAAGHPLGAELSRFKAHSSWALEAARFAARREAAGGAPWWRWPDNLRSRDAGRLAEVDAELSEAIHEALVHQFLFERQWSALRGYAAARGVEILGDMPIYVMGDSADVWADPAGWQMAEDGTLPVVSGVPPDMFAEDGQLWGGPLYDWAHMAKDDYRWWRHRLARALVHADAVRVDHFRAFSAYWEVPGGAPNARGGRWVPGPGLAFFEAVERHMGRLPLCAEDLGTIDDDVRALLAATRIPGMRVMHYGFGGEADNPHLPHNVDASAVIYPGNHDNDTTAGWWSTLSDPVRSHAQHYLGRHGDDIAWDLNRAALASRAALAVIQVQDLLTLGSEARMNDPASYARPADTWRNWRWRLHPDQLGLDVAERLRFLAGLYGR